MKIYNPSGFSSKLTGSFSGSFVGDGSNITSISSDNIEFNFTALSSSAQIADDISGSFTSTSQSLASRIASQESFSSSLDSTFATDAQVSTAVSALNAATSSYLLNTTDTLTGDLTVTGTLTAQDLHVQEVTSSIIYSSGSNIFGENVSDTQTFTGSLQVSGSTNYLLGSVGIGTTSPTYKTHIQGTGDHRLYLFNPGLTSSDKAVLQAEVSGSSSGNAYAFFGRTGAGWSSGVNVSTNKYIIRSNWDVAEDASARLVIDSSGRVGIGTTSPSANLHVESTSLASLNVITSGVADAAVNIQGYDAGVHIGDYTNGNRWVIWNDGVSTSSSLKIGSYALGTWYADGAQVMTITSNGSVGIGATSPGYKLQVSGTTYINETLYVNGDTTIDANLDLTSGGRVKVSGGNTDQYYFEGARNGVGVTYRLYDNANNIYHDSYTSQVIRVNQIGGSGGEFVVSGGDTSFNSNNVKINGGTNYNNKSNLYLSNNRTLIQSDIVNLTANGDTSLDFQTRSGGSTASSMFIDEFRRVGIGTNNPSNLLTVWGGNVYIRGGDSKLIINNIAGASNNEDVVFQRNDSTQFSLGLNNSDHFTLYGGTTSTSHIVVKSDSNVGIGTTNPAARLHVMGGLNLQQAGQLTERTTGVEANATQNTWYTVHTFNQYELTCFFLLVGFEDDTGDSNNRTAIFVDSGSSSYGLGFAPTRLTGSTSIEAQRSGQALQIRFTHVTGGSNRNLRWSLLTVAGV